MLGLVLGGGAAKGYAHIGVIKLLEELEIKPDIIVGASMGALIGGFYAKGFTAKEMEDIALSINKKRKKELFKMHFSKKGLIDGKNIVKFISGYLENTMIEELPVKYAAVATDIEENREIIINRGDLIQAIRSSISIPVVFVPHRSNGRILIDGGFINPVPVDVAIKLGAAKVIAVNVLQRFEYSQVYISAKQSSGKSYNIKHIFTGIFNLINSRLIDYSRDRLHSGVWIDIDTTTIGMAQFERAQPAIIQGYEQAKKQQEKILSIL